MIRRDLVGPERAVAHSLLYEELADLHVPALAIAAEFDAGFPPALVKQAVAKMPRGEYVEIAGSAQVSLDPAKVEQIRMAMSDFLARRAPVGTRV